jgi:internalin A
VVRGCCGREWTVLRPEDTVWVGRRNQDISSHEDSRRTRHPATRRIVWQSPGSMATPDSVRHSRDPLMRLSRDQASREALRRIRDAWSSRSQKLDLHDLGLTALPAEVGRLTNLQELDLRSNQLTALPTEVGQLTTLQMLDLGDNLLAALPAEVGQLTNLQTLNLSSNQLTALPAEVGRLTNLQMLHLGGNQLTALPAEVGRLTSLQGLYLWGNRLTALPTEVGQLTNILDLDLASNQLTALPAEVGRLANLRGLPLWGNQLAEPLPELVEQGTDALLAYLRSLRDAEAQYEAKLLLLGDGEAGKSSVVAQMRGEGFDPDRSSTHGIELAQLRRPHPDRDRQAMITLHTWDFGGQPLYQATHQLFLTPQALYLLVWNPRHGTGEQVDRWLRRIHLLVGDQARVLLVATHADRHHADLDLAVLRRAYPMVLAGLVEVDNRSGTNIDHLRQAITEQAARLPQMGEPVSRRWIAARDQLLSRSDPQLDRLSCIAVCAERGLDATEAEALLRLLHVRGQLLWYADDPGLRELVVLQPEWLAKAISYVLEDRATAAAGGVLDHARLRDVWQHRADGPAYPARLHPYLLRLMEYFDVSYRLDPPDVSLVGQLVPHARPALPWGLDDLPAPGMRSLSVRCRFGAEATGLMAWLTVRNHRFTTGRHWRRGVFLELPGEFASQGQLELVGDRQLALAVHARAPEHFFHVLLDGVRELIRQRWPGMDYELLVPCAHRPQDQPCQGRFLLTALQQLRADGVSELHCPTCGVAQDVSWLLTGYPGRVASGPASEAELLARFGDFKQQLNRIERTGQLVLEATATIAGLTRVVLQLWTSQYEAADGCPRLYTLTPVDPRGIHKGAMWKQPFQLTLWCEHDQQPHPLRAARYTFTRDKDWWATFAPHATLVVRILRHVLRIATPTLALAVPVDDLRQAKADLDTMGKLLDQLPAQLPAQLADPDLANEPAVASGAGLRALRALLADLDRNRTFGDLRVVRTATNDLLWVCPNHYPIYVPPRPVLPAGELARPPE